MIPQRTLTGVCEIKNGQFMVMNRPPIFTGEKAALQVECSFNFNGEAYTIPSGVVAEMYLRYPNTDKMTMAVEMSISGNTAVGLISDEQTGLAGYPLLVIQLTDIISGSLIVACSCPVKISDVRGNLVIDSRAPSPSEVVYVGRSPYIDSTTGNWMEWDTQRNDYIDTGVHAKGDKGDKGDTGAAAGFGTPTATVDSNVGTPSVEVTASGPDTAKVFGFQFHNMKGEKGDTGDPTSATAEDIPMSSTDDTTIAEKVSTDFETVSGNPITVETDSAQVAEKTVIHLEPKQDLHGYDHPWPAGGGKNLMPLILDDIKAVNTNGTWYNNKYTLNGIVWTFITDSDGNITAININGTRIGDSIITFLGPSMQSLSSKEFYFRIADSDLGVRINFNYINTNGAVIQTKNNIATNSTATVGSDFDKLRPIMYVLTESSINITVYPVICLNSEADKSYAPYSNICPITGWTGAQIVVSPTTDVEDGTTYDITFPIEAGTVYGGTLTIEKDGSGTLVVDRASIEFDGSSDEAWSSYNGFITNYGSSNLPGVAFPEDVDNLIPTTAMASYLKAVGARYTASSAPCFSIQGSSNHRFDINIGDETLTVENFRNYLANNPLQVVYPLATPITYTLTAEQVTLLKGINHISTDGTSLDLTHRKGAFATLEDVHDITESSEDVSIYHLGFCIKDGKLCQIYYKEEE